ncbi:MAG: GAF domain-containing protein [Paludibacteraceae bacterium]|nr:GAF domain-containing protein [Paludibacteraceae bacterium]
MMTDKAEKYQILLPQLEALLSEEKDSIAKMANVAAVLHSAFGFWWTGFYRVEGDELILGPFQGHVACMHIPFGRGVCGTAWKQAQTVIVPDVHKFAGHIACSSESNSEIVVPVFRDKDVVAVLDIDSTEFGTFNETDRQYLEQIVKTLF